MMTLRVLMDGQRINDFTVPWVKITDASLERYAYDYAKRHKISPRGIRVVPLLDSSNVVNPYNKHQVRK